MRYLGLGACLILLTAAFASAAEPGPSRAAPRQPSARIQPLLPLSEVGFLSFLERSATPPLRLPAAPRKPIPEPAEMPPGYQTCAVSLKRCSQKPRTCLIGVRRCPTEGFLVPVR